MICRNNCQALLLLLLLLLLVASGRQLQGRYTRWQR
jgi:hypothetical protein